MRPIWDTQQIRFQVPVQSWRHRHGLLADPANSNNNPSEPKEKGPDPLNTHCPSAGFLKVAIHFRIMRKTISAG